MSHHRPFITITVHIPVELERILTKEKHFSHEEISNLAEKIEPFIEDDYESSYGFIFADIKKARQFVKELEKKL